jgi:hypothetical protein
MDGRLQVGPIDLILLDEPINHVTMLRVMALVWGENFLNFSSPSQECRYLVLRSICA